MFSIVTDSNLVIYPDGYENQGMVCEDNVSVNKGDVYKRQVNYMTDMPKVFNCSRININPVMRNIRTGIPLRAWDIIGAGGFLMTSFQLEYMDFFENGKDYVYYESHDDLLRRCV